MSILEIPSTTYHADDIADTPTLSKSIIQILLHASPAHARYAHPKLNPTLERIEEAKFDVGNAAHQVFLEGIDRIQVVYFDDWRKQAAKDARDEARSLGKIPLLERQAEETLALVAAIREQLDRVDVQPPLFQAGKPEQTVVWDDRFGVQCRARLDWLRDDLTAIDDLKTTSRSANPAEWCRSSLWNVGADVQAAFYTRGVQALTEKRPEFRFAVIETAPPYALSVIAMGPDVVALADKKVDYALALWARCLRDGEWPAYEPRVAYAELPAWMEAQWLERELREVAAA